MKDAIKHGIVKSVTNGIQISRHGRGYSKNELVQSVGNRYSNCT